MTRASWPNTSILEQDVFFVEQFPDAASGRSQPPSVRKAGNAWIQESCVKRIWLIPLLCKPHAYHTRTPDYHYAAIISRSCKDL